MEHDHPLFNHWRPLLIATWLVTYSFKFFSFFFFKIKTQKCLLSLDKNPKCLHGKKSITKINQTQKHLHRDFLLLFNKTLQFFFIFFYVMGSNSSYIWLKSTNYLSFIVSNSWSHFEPKANNIYLIWCGLFQMKLIWFWSWYKGLFDHVKNVFLFDTIIS